LEEINLYKIIETFVGAGGAHLGFLSEGFESKYALDINEDSIKTLLYNNPKLKSESIVEVGDILDADGHEILNKSKLKVGEADVMFGGIVCKGFSMAGERSPNDERNYFYHKQIELCSIIKPKISIIENVKGILNAMVLSIDTPDSVREEVNTLWQNLEDFKGKKSIMTKNGLKNNEFNQYGDELKKQKQNILKKLETEGYLVPVVKDIYDLYEKIGYKVKHKMLNAAWYGSFTKRERIIFVATRKDLNIDFEYPYPTHMDSTIVNNGYKNELDSFLKPRTVGDALNLIDYSDSSDIDNEPMKHKAKTVRRFSYIPEGKNIVSVMDKLPNELKISKFYSRGNTMRLDRNSPSPTLVPGHSNFPVHPIEDRSITVREAATITGFPLNYKFYGSHTKRCELVGNAVPIHLSKAIAKACKKTLDEYYENQK
jgi:DNA (cytosine-5)-methyltransferase 1